MLFRQYLDKEPVVAVSYPFGCPTKGIGAVVDPIGDVDRYLKESEPGNLPIRFVIETHMHADHISSGRELAEAAAAEYVFFAGTEASYSFRGVQDGEVLDMGNTQAEVLHTPGHTPEHISLVVTDHARGDEPWFVLTGHTLMVGDMGRTELATSAEEGAAALFESATRLRGLPDHLEVMPGAFSGSVVGEDSADGRALRSASSAAITVRSRWRTKRSSSASCSPRFRPARSRPNGCAQRTSGSILLLRRVTRGSYVLHRP